MTAAFQRLPLYRDSRALMAFSVLLFVGPVTVHALVGVSGASWLPLAVACMAAVGGFGVWPVRGLLVFAVFVLFVDTLDRLAGPSIKQVDEIVLPLVALATVSTRWRQIPSRFRRTRELGVAIVALAGLASSIAAGVPITTWLPAGALLAKAIVVFYVAFLLEITLADALWSMRVVLVVGVIVLAVGGLELVAPTAYAAIGLTPATPRAGLPAIKSLFYHPLLFAWLCAFVSLYLVAHHVVFRRRWMLVLALLFSVGTILAARRRTIIGVLVGLAAGIGLDVTAGPMRRWTQLRRWVPAAIGTAVLAAIFLPAFSGLYDLTIQRYVVPGGIVSGGGSDTLTDETPARLALYEGALWIARDDFPLGGGLGRYGSWISREHYSSLYAQYGLDKVYGLSPANPSFVTDTFWPQILGELGVLGLAGYVLFVGALIVELWKAARQAGAPLGLAALQLSALLILVQSLVESLASPIFTSPSQAYLIMLALGGTLNLSRGFRDAP